MVSTPRLTFSHTVFAALVMLSTAVAMSAAAADKEALSSAVSKEASACRRKAMDYRVLALNALKNADAARAKAHEALIHAMDSGDAHKIKKTMDEHENAAEELEETIEDVEKVITHAMDADALARDVLSMCKAADESKDDEKTLDEKKCRSMLASGGKSLAKAEKVVKKLKTQWLEPAFATTTTTSTTTTTTNSKADEK